MLCLSQIGGGGGGGGGRGSYNTGMTLTMSCWPWRGKGRAKEGGEDSKGGGLESTGIDRRWRGGRGGC